MKRMILALVAIMTMTAAQAQGERPGRGERRNFDRTEMLKRRTDDAVKKYGLNEEQAAQLLELNKKYADKMGPGMGGLRGGRRGGARPSFDGNVQQRPQLTEEQKQQMETQRKQREEAMKQYDEELQKIMTPEQYKVYKEDADKRMREGGREGRGRGQRPQN